MGGPCDAMSKDAVMVKPEISDEGYLVEADTWNESFARERAVALQLELTAEHWELIHLAREFYLRFALSPSMRPFVQFMKKELGVDKGSSLYFTKLFPESSTRDLCRLAGLPKPTRCL